MGREPLRSRCGSTGPFARGLVTAIASTACLLSLSACFAFAPREGNVQPPEKPVKLIFIHHSCGENWLADANGGLGKALGRNNYFVSDTNYGWGPGGLGDRTDITDWPEWFTGDRRDGNLRALYRESGRHCDYTRTLDDPGGENRVVLFKSCFPNSNLRGRPDDAPARGEGLTVANAKAIYHELLGYFATRPDKLFVVITAPPVQDPAHAANARAFNNWLVKDWLADYRGKNVAVFDFYNVLTGPGNHHRVRDGRIEHTCQAGNTLRYPSNGDDHPSRAGNRKATEELVPLLNLYYHRWVATAPKAPPSAPPAEAAASRTPAEPKPEPSPPEPDPSEPSRPAAPKAAGMIDDFEAAVRGWSVFRDEGTATRLEFARDEEIKHDGAASLRIDYDVAPQGWATCSLVHDRPKDWSGCRGLSLYVRAAKAGQRITIVVYEGKTPDELRHFEHSFEAGEAAAGKWQRLDLRWDQLKLPEWQGDAEARLDPRSAMGVALAFPSEGGRNTGRLWIDHVTLLPAAPGKP